MYCARCGVWTGAGEVMEEHTLLYFTCLPAIFAGGRLIPLQKGGAEKTFAASP